MAGGTHSTVYVAQCGCSSPAGAGQGPQEGRQQPQKGGQAVQTQLCSGVRLPAAAWVVAALGNAACWAPLPLVLSCSGPERHGLNPCTLASPAGRAQQVKLAANPRGTPSLGSAVSGLIPLLSPHSPQRPDPRGVPGAGKHPSPQARAAGRHTGEEPCPAQAQGISSRRLRSETLSGLLCPGAGDASPIGKSSSAAGCCACQDTLISEPPGLRAVSAGGGECLHTSVCRAPRLPVSLLLPGGGERNC